MQPPPDRAILTDCREGVTKDLITLAAEANLLDEASARNAIADRRATTAALVELGLLKAQDLDRLLTLYHHEMSRTLRPDEATLSACGKCGQAMTREGGDILCVPCGLHITPKTAEATIPLEVEQAAQDPNNRVGQYIRTRPLGEGAFGEVALAWDTRLSRPVALKLLKGAGPAELARFRREASLAAGLSHPNVAAVYEVGDDPPYIAMQYVDGETVSGRQLEVAEAVRIIKTAAEAVYAAHEKGIIHRDLKPSNLMVDANGRVFVMDFGLAKQTDVESTISQSGVIAGTPAFMSPEQARGEMDLDARSDIFGLGSTLYTLLSGAPPFEGQVMDVLRKVIHEEPRALKVERDVVTIVQKAMEKEPGRRYRSAKELAEDLGRYLAGEPILAHPPSTLYRLRKRLMKRLAVVAVSGVGLLAVAIVAGFLVPQWLSEAGARKQKEAELETERSERLKDLEARAAARPHLDAGRQVLMRIDAMQRTTGWTDEQLRGLAGEALGEFEKAVSIRPDYPEAHLEAARVYREVRDTDRAIEMCDRAITASDEFATAYLERALINLRRYETLRHRPDGEVVAETDASRELQVKILGDLDKVRNWSNEKKELQLAEGAIAFSGGRYEEAGRLLHAYAATAVADARAWYMTAHAYVHITGKEQETIDATTRMLELRPRDPHGYFTRATAQARLGNHAAAIEDYDATIRLDAGVAMVYFNRGIARANLGDPAAAIEDYDAAIRLDPKDPAAYNNRGVAREKLGNYAAAIEDFDAAIRLDPKLADAYFNRGAARAKLRVPAAAIEDYDAAIRLDPKLVEAYNNRGIAQMKLGNHAAAIEDYDTAIRLDPTYAMAYANRGLARAGQGKNAAAIEDYDTAIRLDPKLAGAYCNRGLAQARMTNYAASIESFDEAIRLNPKFTSAYNDRGLSRRAKGDLKGAIRDFTEAIRLSPRWGTPF